MVGQVAVTQVRTEPLLTFIRVCVRLGPHPTLPYPCMGLCNTVMTCGIMGLKCNFKQQVFSPNRPMNK